jgi:hypothetical protein
MGATLTTLGAFIADSVALSNILHSDGSWAVTENCYFAATYLTFHLFTSLGSLVGACMWINTGNADAFHELSRQNYFPKLKSAVSSFGVLILVCTIIIQFIYAVIAVGNLTLSSDSLECRHQMPSLWKQCLADSILMLLMLLVPILTWIPVAVVELFSFLMTSIRGPYELASGSESSQIAQSTSPFTPWKLFIRTVLLVLAIFFISDCAVVPYSNQSSGCQRVFFLLIAHLVVTALCIAAVLMWACQSSHIQTASELDMFPLSSSWLPLLGFGMLCILIFAKGVLAPLSFFALALDSCEFQSGSKLLLSMSIFDFCFCCLAGLFWLPRMCSAHKNHWLDSANDSLLNHEQVEVNEVPESNLNVQI